MGPPSTVVGFALQPGGKVSGHITDALTGAPLENIDVHIRDADNTFYTAGKTDASGDYTTIVLPAGTYYAHTWNNIGYLDELYDDLPCAGGCDPSVGTPITITAGSTTPDINFVLEHQGGRISGTITDAVTSTGLEDVSVEIYNPANSLVATALTDASGNYTSTGLASGIYYARTRNDLLYVNELYDNLPCLGVWQADWCDPNMGTAISVAAGTTTTGIDFGLEHGGRISGNVIDSSSGAPLRVNVVVYDSRG